MAKLPYSSELQTVLSEARDLARETGRATSSGHLLAALYTEPNQARDYLRERAIAVDQLLTRRPPADPPGLVEAVLDRAERMARGGMASTVTSLHLLAALSAFKDGSAYKLLLRAGIDVAELRTIAMGFLTSGERPSRYRTAGEPGALLERTMATGASGGAGSSGGAEARQRGAGTSIAFHPQLDQTRTRTRRSTPLFDAGQPVVPPPATPPAPPQPAPTALAASPPPVADPPANASGTGGRTPSSDSELAKRLFGGSKKNKRVTPVSRKQRPASEKAGAPAAGPSATPTAARPPAPTRASRAKGGGDPGDAWELDPADFPTLVRFGRNLTAAAARGTIDSVVGRDREIGQLIDILNKRRANNPVLVGEAGVGKTAVVEGLACRMVSGQAPGLGDRVLIELEAGRVFGGTGLRGSLAERLVALRKEVAGAEGKIVVFLDEVHRWLAGAGDQGVDGVEELKPALARGDFPCIGATTHAEYKKSFENDSAFARRFQMVRVEEPSVDETIEILRGVRPLYAEHHDVDITDEALATAARLAHRHLTTRRNPDKALAVLDLAGSKARRDAQRVDERMVAKVIAEMSGVPESKLLMSERERFLRMEDHLMASVVGHERSLARIAHVLRRNYAGFVTGRPIGSFLFLGPTGVGKTETAKALADFLFHSGDAMTVIDMSELAEAHSVARLIGAPPGYVGHDGGGQLTDAVRQRPYQIVLFDEIEKAHPTVHNLLLQVLDEGRLTDSRGRTTDFTQTVVVMTSNLGAGASLRARAPLGFGRDEAEEQAQREEPVIEAARAGLTPELWNRIDEPLVFGPLSRSQVERIAHLKLQQSSRRLLDEKGIAYACEPAVVSFLVDHGGYDPSLGARPMRRALERYVEGPIADLILRGEVVAPAQILVSVGDGELSFAIE
jgi:ATP-dependent Clp protease ATP-binding subunit ClpC